MSKSLWEVPPMPVHVPGSLGRLLSLLEPCFSQPAFQTFRALVVGFIARVGEHTVCGMWQAVRLAGRVHHLIAHDFFARRRWDPDRLGVMLLEFLVTVFVKPGTAITVADRRHAVRTFGQARARRALSARRLPARWAGPPHPLGQLLCRCRAGRLPAVPGRAPCLSAGAVQVASPPR